MKTPPFQKIKWKVLLWSLCKTLKAKALLQHYFPCIFHSEWGRIQKSKILILSNCSFPYLHSLAIMFCCLDFDVWLLLLFITNTIWKALPLSKVSHKKPHFPKKWLVQMSRLAHFTFIKNMQSIIESISNPLCNDESAKDAESEIIHISTNKSLRKRIKRRTFMLQKGRLSNKI